MQKIFITQNYKINWQRREFGGMGEENGWEGEVQGGVFMPWVLPGFGTTVKNGHEERIKHREQRGVEEVMQRREAGEQNDAWLKLRKCAQIFY